MISVAMHEPNTATAHRAENISWIEIKEADGSVFTIFLRADQFEAAQTMSEFFNANLTRSLELASATA